MVTNHIKGHWNELKGKLKQRIAVLTDNELMFNEGKEDVTFGKIQKKLGRIRRLG